MNAESLFLSTVKSHLILNLLKEKGVSLNIFVGKSHQIFNTDNLTYQAERAICKAGLFEESPILNVFGQVFLLHQIWIIKYYVKYSTVDCKYFFFLQNKSLD